MDKAKLLVDPSADAWTLALRHKKGHEIFEGAEAMRVAGLVLPKLNYMAGSKQTVRDAVEQIETTGGPTELLARVPHEVFQRDRSEGVSQKKRGLISRLPKPTKLALEMALHEGQEQRALAGELLDLEAAWRAAEEVAHIADNLLVPPEIEEQIERLKGE